jgi:threonylcarbamoyladenosine tRNA methylthiotransferase MtaB
MNREADESLQEANLAERTYPVRLETFGCRLNAYESEAMQALAADSGLSGAIVFNTCAVTAEAVRQAEQRIRKLRRESPDALIIVTGCAAQIEPARFGKMPEVDLVIGNRQKLESATWKDIATEGLTPRWGMDQDEKIRVDDVFATRANTPRLIDGFGSRTRAFVQVQNGCDHRCTFCVIPFGRGESRSTPAGVVVEQVRRLVEQGYREIVLTGVDLTSWGTDLPPIGGRSLRLGDLTQRILRLVPDLPRLRLSSIDNVETDPALLDAIHSDMRLMPHLHLSLQAGSDIILKRMKRRHLRDDAIEFCAQIRAMRPEMVFGADIIAGFPTESEDDFAQSLNLIEACRLTHLHVFPYSPRPNTPAARMPQVPRAAVKRRAQALRESGARMLREYLQSRIGETERVLLEKPDFGHTEGYAAAVFKEPFTRGDIVTVNVIGAARDHLICTNSSK